MRLGDSVKVEEDAISSGSLLIDQALGIGGYPRGRIVKIFGPESSVKLLWLFMQLQKFKNGGKRHLSMPKMRLIQCMLKI